MNKLVFLLVFPLSVLVLPVFSGEPVKGSLARCLGGVHGKSDNFEKNVILRAQCHVDYQDYEGAMSVLADAIESVLRSNGNTVRYDQQLSRLHQMSSRVYSLMGDSSSSLVEINNAIAVWPGQWSAYLDRGGVYFEMNKFSPAIRDHNIAYRMSKDQPIVLWYLTYVNAEAGCYSYSVYYFKVLKNLIEQGAEYWSSSAERGMEVAEAYLSENYDASSKKAEPPVCANNLKLH